MSSSALSGGVVGECACWSAEAVVEADRGCEREEACAFVAVAVVGTHGYLTGSLVGWWIGRRGERPFLERHGRWLHLSPARMQRAERWFARWDDWAVFLGRVTPLARSFISIPAGAFRAPPRRYTVLILFGSALWAFAFAAVGYALGANWETFHHSFRYVEYAVAVALILVA